MRIAFKSLLILHQSRSNFGNKTTTTTIYDMRSESVLGQTTTWSV
jgi:hypothetical protein